MMHTARFLAASAALAAATSLHAVTLTFDELPFQPVHGLSYQGITFTFEVGGIASVDAYYGAVGPGALTYVADPVLEGDAAGILTLSFATPTPVFEFGLALSSFDPLAPGAVVELYDGAVLAGSFNLNTDPLVSFTEGYFAYSGSPINKAVISFDPVASRFALDNLQVIPESGIYAGPFAFGLAVLAGYRRYRA